MTQASSRPGHEPQGRTLIEFRRPDGTLYALAEQARLWAIFDPAGAPAVYAHLPQLDPTRAAPLTRGDASERYAAVTPWLARADAALCDWVRDTLLTDPEQADSWGLYIVAVSPSATLPEVRRRLGRLLTVRLPEGDLVRFRFYDPRVMQVFLSSADAEELAMVFGRELAAVGLSTPASADVKFYFPSTSRPHLPYSLGTLRAGPDRTTLADGTQFAGPPGAKA